MVLIAAGGAALAQPALTLERGVERRQTGRVIVVAGEALIDRIRDPGGHVRDLPGGGPFNTARALARLGTPVSFLGRFSTDAQGDVLRAALSGAGVDLALVSSGPEPTTIAQAELDAGGGARYQFAVDGTSAPALSNEMVPAAFGHDVVALQVGSLGLLLEPIATTLATLVERERGRLAIVLDPNVRPGLGDPDRHRERLRSTAATATIVKTSDTDLAFMEPGAGFEAAAQRLLARGAQMVVVTLGDRGAFAAHRGLRVTVPAADVRVVDTIGAGDVFGAALLSWLRRRGRLHARIELGEDDLRQAMRHACAAAAVKCAHRGAYAPSAEEVAAAEDRGRA